MPTAPKIVNNFFILLFQLLGQLQSPHVARRHFTPNTEAIPALQSFLPILINGVMMSRLTTHVLDTAHGKPGQGIQIDLYKIVDNSRKFLLSKNTNTDGRCDGPLLEGDAFQTGVYELDFHIGNYFTRLGMALPKPGFLDVVTLRFGVADASRHYHVPLVASPWSYSTYRGS
jgi:5-hydroxyisourate hydrolase